MAANAEAQRQIDRLLDADAHGGKQFVPLASIVEHLERRPGIEQVEAIVIGPREPKRLAKPAWTRSELAGFGASRKAAILLHLLQTCDWFESAQQNAAGLPLWLA